MQNETLSFSHNIQMEQESDNVSLGKQPMKNHIKKKKSF